MNAGQEPAATVANWKFEILMSNGWLGATTFQEKLMAEVEVNVQPAQPHPWLCIWSKQTVWGVHELVMGTYTPAESELANVFESETENHTVPVDEVPLMQNTNALVPAGALVVMLYGSGPEGVPPSIKSPCKVE